MGDSAIELYLELLKKAILFEIWIDNDKYLPVPPEVNIPNHITKFLNDNHLNMVKSFQPDREKRRQGLDYPPSPNAHSMIGRLRMENLHQCMEHVLKDKVEGDFIETGVWRGGACIFMRGFLKAHGIMNRRVWVADSFEGLPEPDEIKYPKDKGSQHHFIDFLKVSLQEVMENFKKYDLLDEQVCFLKGWFKDTLPQAPIDKIAVLRFDGDMYGSTMDCLKNLYEKVSKGGFVIIDDYGLPNCAAAVTDFRNESGIKEPLIKIDQFGVYWRKTNQ